MWTEKIETERNSGFEDGGGGEIRTLDALSSMHAFQACALGHYATPPRYAAFSGAVYF